jgi:hypothetical protein
MKSRLAFCAVLLGIASTIAVGQQVSVNYNHSASFSQYHTYAWGSNNANQIQNSILAQVAQQDINSAMQGKGLQMVQESQNPDIILTANSGMRQQTSYSAWGMRGIGGGMGGITPEQNVEGTMIVDLYDAKTQSLIWRGIAQDTLNKNGNKNQQMVEKAVQKMFKQWPK